LLLVPLEALFWRQFSWLKASLLFVFHFLVLFQLIVRCIVLLLHCLLRFFLVSPSILFLCFHLALPYEIMGGCWCRYLSTLGHSSPIIPPHRSVGLMGHWETFVPGTTVFVQGTLCLSPGQMCLSQGQTRCFGMHAGSENIKVTTVWLS